MKQVYEGKHIVVLDRDDWEYVERKKATEAVVVVAMTEDREVILTEQKRRPVDAKVIDWPAGLVGDEDDATPEETAKKELEEETGYTCKSVEFLAKGPTSPGITSEIVSFYRARGVKKEGSGGGVGGEDITVHVVRLTEVREWLQKKKSEGVLIDLKIWGGLYFLTGAS
ncbi:MAG TPA: NUDIX hydrolase [Thermoanaerobaculia bacterium]|nr:NUDIX hydrolase [Thermoanaerobaculia bacterium]